MFCNVRAWVRHVGAPFHNQVGARAARNTSSDEPRRRERTSSSRRTLGCRRGASRAKSTCAVGRGAGRALPLATMAHSASRLQKPPPSRVCQRRFSHTRCVGLSRAHVRGKRNMPTRLLRFMLSSCTRNPCFSQASNISLYVIRSSAAEFLIGKTSPANAR